MVTIRHRIAAATGALYVILILIGNTLATSGDSTSTHPTGAQVLRDAARHAHSAQVTAGFVLEVLGFTLLIVFLGYLAATFARARFADDWSPVLGATAVVSGITMLAIKLGSAAPVVALAMDRHDLDPTLARVLNDINGAAFVLSWLPTAVFVGAAAVALLRAGLVGRPTAWIGAALGLVGVPLAIIGLDTPASANPMACLLGLLWVMIVSARLAVRPGRRVDEQAGPDASRPRATATTPATAPV
jgi:hypothetical protein